MADGNQVRREPPTSITEEEKARRKDIISRTDHDMSLEGMERGRVSARAAELWVEGKITAEEKREMVRDKYRKIAAKNGVVYDV